MELRELKTLSFFVGINQTSGAKTKKHLHLSGIKF